MTPFWTIDFETLPIGPRPHHYPPEPVGLAVRTPEGESYYMAWGHPTGNNCSRVDAERVLRAIWAEDRPILFHHAKFDLAVCYEIFGLPVLPWDRVQDTMFLAFLLDPYARSIGLKQLAETWLGMPPEEQDTVVDWVLAHKDDVPLFEFVTNSKGEPNGKPSKKNAGAWIAYTPAEIVGPYAIGDVERTAGLFRVMYPAVLESGMGDAYDVERRLLPHIMENERTGIRVDLERLERDVVEYRRWFEMVEGWLRWRLNAPGLNFDADNDVADYLESTGIVTEFAKTRTGRRSVSKKTLHPESFTDQAVAQALGYRNRLKTCLSMFMEPWLKQARTWGGRVSCEWNMVSNPDGGTRTGRPSTRNHNFLNISKEFEGRDGYTHPTHLPGLPELPLVRCYILPDDGHVLNGRDFDGQEMRVFGHFENGDLQRQYRVNPKLDVHAFVGGNITQMTGQELKRGQVKVLNFQALYGGGVPAAKDALRCTYAEAQRFKAFHDSALPGRKILADQLSLIVRAGGAVRTYGGRLYVRPPMKKQKDGRLGDSDYILINYLVQGSSADVTKRALLRLLDDPEFASRWLLNVYDELVISSPVEIADQQSLVMKRAMEGVPLRVQLLTDAEQGSNWGEMQDRSDL